MPQDSVEHSSREELNKKLENYNGLEQKEKQDVLTYVRSEARKSRETFEQRMSESKCDLSRPIFIVGATGSGKSTLLNYLNGLPMVVQKRRFSHMPILECDENVKLRSDYAKIAHGEVSETSIPNFAKSSNGQLTYVDCAGEFDNKDVVQSIINSYFKKDLADKAKEISIAIAVNYNSLYMNRGTCFTQVLNELSKFTNDWSQLQYSTTLIVTNVPYQDGIEDGIMNQVAEIAKNVKDLGVCKPILESICRRKSISFFLQPFQVEFKIPVGQLYKIDSERTKGIGTIGSINKTLESVEPTSVREVQFYQYVKPKAQPIIEGVCEDLVNQMQTSIISAIQTSVRSWSEVELKKYKKIIPGVGCEQDLFDKISIKEPSSYQSDKMDFQAFVKMSHMKFNGWDIIKRALEKEVFQCQSKYDKQAKQHAEQQAKIAQEKAKQEKEKRERMEKEKKERMEKEKREKEKREKEKRENELKLALKEKELELAASKERNRTNDDTRIGITGAGVGFAIGGPVGAGVGYVIGSLLSKLF